MKTFRFLSVAILLLLLSSNVYSQRGRGHGREVVAVHRSHYRPARVGIYHPHWRPAYAYHRRWVYFPRYNFYWDNWRNHYVFWNGTVWWSQPAPPPLVVNVNLQNEKSMELNENDDDVDDIYQTNNTHKTQYKAP